MKKSTMLATAAFAVLLGLFVPCTSHATEIKDTDPTTVQWNKATRKECTNSEGVSYVDYTFPEDQTQSYNSYDDAVTSLAKFTVDAVADHKSNYIILRVPVKIKSLHLQSYPPDVLPHINETDGHEMAEYSLSEAAEPLLDLLSPQFHPSINPLRHQILFFYY